MQFRFNHNNINVLDLDRSVRFYREALGFQEVRRMTAPDGSFTLVFLGDGQSDHMLELTWLRDRTEPYNLGENEFHMAMTTPLYDDAKALHRSMGCICYENPTMDLYFIADPDGYWIEILPSRK